MELGNSFSQLSKSVKRSPPIRPYPWPFNDSDSSRENKVLSDDFDEGIPKAIKDK